jgi:hypothetical protein
MEVPLKEFIKYNKKKLSFFIYYFFKYYLKVNRVYI